MRLLNLSDSALRLPIGGGIRIEPNSLTGNIVLTPQIVREAILPIINFHGIDKIRMSVNSSELGVLDVIGVPAEVVVEDSELTELLKKATGNKAPVKAETKLVDDTKSATFQPASKLEPKVTNPEPKVEIDLDPNKKPEGTDGNLLDIKLTKADKTEAKDK